MRREALDTRIQLQFLATSRTRLGYQPVEQRAAVA